MPKFEQATLGFVPIAIGMEFGVFSKFWLKVCTFAVVFQINIILIFKQKR